MPLRNKISIFLGYRNQDFHYWLRIYPHLQFRSNFCRRIDHRSNCAV